MTSKIIEYKPNVNVANAKGQTPILIACESKNTEIIELLIKKGASINKKCLEMIVRSQATKIVDLLLNHLKSDRSFSELMVHVCAESNNLPIATQFFSETFDVECKIDDHMTLVQKSVMFCSLNFVEFLCERGADVQVVDHKGRNLLHLCLSYGADVDIVEFLLKRGVNVNQKDREGETALHYVVDRSATPAALFDLIIKHGAFFNAQDADGYTPLHLVAARVGSAYVVDALLGLKARDDLRTAGGETPLHIAVRCGNLDVVKRLINKSNWAALTIENLSAVKYAKLYGFDDVAKYIEDNFATGTDEKGSACATRKFKSSIGVAVARKLK